MVVELTKPMPYWTPPTKTTPAWLETRSGQCNHVGPEGDGIG